MMNNSNFKKSSRFWFLTFMLCLAGMVILTAYSSFLYSAQLPSGITSPEEFFGFQLGSDRHIARWDKIVDYFYLLEKQSSKIKVVNMGPTTSHLPVDESSCHGNRGDPNGPGISL